MLDTFSLPDLSSSVSTAALGAALVVFLFLARRALKKSQYPLPPGLPGKPIVGNFFSLPKKEGWLLPTVFRDAGRSLGTDILYLNIFGSHAIVVNTAEAATELFQRRSNIYSNRPPLNALHKILGIDWFTALMQPDDIWKSHRRAFNMNFKTSEYRSVELRSAHTLLRSLLVTPDDFMAHFRRMNTATTMAISYGIDMADGSKEHLVGVGKGILDAISFGTSAMALVFDAIPSMLRTPGWFFGGQYKRDALPYEQASYDTVDVPFKELERAVAEDRAKPSIVQKMLANAQTKEERELARAMGGNLYFSGVNNVNSPLGGFIMAMAKYPEAQKRAQKELDDVVGAGRLPDFSDLPSLPFIDAIVREVIRWHPITPLVTPHAAAEEDVYKGYRIPKGTWVIGNAWAILHDENTYPEPEAFKPERWLARPTSDFPFATFGFGRRLCPGIAYTRDMLCITMASVLATYNIEFPVDAAGTPIVPEEEWTPTLFSYPAPFKAKLTPRSDTAKQLILATASEEPLTDV